MQLENTITINAPVEKVWKVLATDFDKASVWMSQVPNSHKIEEEIQTENAPMEGRVCQLSTDPNGLYADERFTYFNAEIFEFDLEVVPHNGSIPVLKNNAKAKLNALGPNLTEVIWSSNITLKPLGKMMYPVLKLGLNRGFNEFLEELKVYVETGKVHARKEKAMLKAS